LDAGAILEYQPGSRHLTPPHQDHLVDRSQQPASNVLIGVLCGAGAAFGWAAGFVAAKHGITIGFSPAELAFHRFFWSSLLLLPIALRNGISDLGGVGWGRGLIVVILAGPPQALVAYTGFILVPLGHGTTIQPATAALTGLILATVILHEKLTVRRAIGCVAIVIGLVIYGAESLATIGGHGVGGDLLFLGAGMFWATFGILLRQWQIAGMRAVGAVVVLSLLLFVPAFFLLTDWHDMLRFGFFENLLQILVQGILAGALPIYLYAYAVKTLGAGRASTFPALVPVFGVVIGFLALGIVPSLPQIIGLAVVLVGFRFALR
jgi:drug/metabolite transporter (DMT)-like permease